MCPCPTSCALLLFLVTLGEGPGYEASTPRHTACNVSTNSKWSTSDSYKCAYTEHIPRKPISHLSHNHVLHCAIVHHEYFHNLTLYSKVCRWSGFIQFPLHSLRSMHMCVLIAYLYKSSLYQEHFSPAYCNTCNSKCWTYLHITGKRDRRHVNFKKCWLQRSGIAVWRQQST